jgi:hypothetical protein
MSRGARIGTVLTEAAAGAGLSAERLDSSPGAESDVTGEPILGIALGKPTVPVLGKAVASRLVTIRTAPAHAWSELMEQDKRAMQTKAAAVRRAEAAAMKVLLAVFKFPCIIARPTGGGLGR